MIDVEYPRLMARYNRWQNRSIFGAASRLDDAARKAPRGAFFGSIEATLNHIMWADQMWMMRFAKWPAPVAKTPRESVDIHTTWASLCEARTSFDARLIDWADALKPSDVEGSLTYFSGSAGRNITKPLQVLIVHFFNHQTHHRGQVHAMLTAAGAPPEDTDIPMMPE